MIKIIFKSSVIILSISLVAGYFEYIKKSNISIADTIRVQRTDLSSYLDLTGITISASVVDIRPSISGRVTKVDISEGDKVTKGQLLYQLDDENDHIALNRSRSTADRIRIELNHHKKKLKSLRDLFAVGGASREAIEDAEYDISILKQDLIIAENDLHLSRYNIDKKRITAPFSGLITDAPVRMGDWVTPGNVTVKLVDPDTSHLESSIDSGDLGLINIGQKAIVSSAAFPDKEWQAVVENISPSVIESNDTNAVVVRLKQHGQPSVLRLGQQVNLKLQIAHVNNALILPFTALVPADHQYKVGIIENGIFRYRTVETGIESIEFVQILSGVKEDDEIVLAGLNTLRDGDRVVIERANHDSGQ